jgi:signal-transduction protein with cAMP-binding, CBS, and nucleotidyltransferase domain/DNA polymerase III epsilon subunit-like protein
MLNKTTKPPGLNAATPLLAMEVVALDTETTGLEVARDRIVQIGAVRMRGAELDAGDCLDLLVNPGVAIPPASTRIHGLSDADVADAPATPEALAQRAGFISSAVVVGHSIHFDLAVLRHEAARHGVAWREPKALDTALLAAALASGRVDNSIEALALTYGIEITGRHTALGDALATARIFAAMLGPLRQRGTRSLAEAEAFQRRAYALIDQQETAGWFASPGERPDFRAAVDALPNAQRAIDSFIYRHRLADVMGAPPITVPPDATLVETAAVMRAHGIGCVVVEPLTDGGGGFITERDVLYALASSETDAAMPPVSAVMSRPVISAPEQTFLYRALGLMARRGLRYLAATGPDGAISGVFTLRSLLQERALATLSLGDQIAAAEDSAMLARVQAELPGLASAMLADGLDARQVAAIISAECRAMTARAAELAQRIMVDQGRGPAPADYCLLVLGSGGRGESLLAPDQDNAVIVDDTYSGDLDAEDDWFTVWAGHLNRLLDEAGIPLCKGGVMAKNRAWRKSLTEWRAQVDAWVANPKPENLLNVDIFFDFAPVLGADTLAWQLRAHALDDAERARVLIRAMAENAGRRGAPIGLFGGFRKDERGRTDLKEGALLALVCGARVMALAHRVGATATPDRLMQATKKAGAGTADARMLIDIHQLVLRLVLNQQIADITAGVPPSNAIETGKLARDQRKTLKQALERLELMDEMVKGVLR